MFMTNTYIVNPVEPEILGLLNLKKNLYFKMNSSFGMLSNKFLNSSIVEGAMSVEFQDEYAQALDNLAIALQNSYEQMRSLCATDTDFAYTQAIANRLRAFYIMQSKTKYFLNKKVAQAGSDFFVETILFFLKLFNDVEGLNLEIASERTVQPKRNAMRPDISIWSGSELLAVVECKTQLGWSRHNWKSDFENREQKLKEVFPDAKMFLVVMSSCNWSGFGDDLKVGKQLFCLLNIWPTALSATPTSDMLYTPIESLLEQLVELQSRD